ncbi:MAG: molybdate ABC transporter substrate-binding protein [Roseiarcus sp.]|jgi:molybdate transport system substrate-binding protein
MRRVPSAFFSLFLALAPASALAQERIVVFAAASLKTALDGAAADYRAHGGEEVAISYGGSLSLERQIAAGAPADIFASADEESMDEAAKANAIRADSRVDLLGNRLVVVAPKTAPFDALALDAKAFEQAIGAGKLATGEVDTVPVGKYAKASLTKLGLWRLVEPRLAMTDNVRAALGFVARGEATPGIVHAADAAAEPAVKIVATFPEESHPPIRYPFALTAASRNAAAESFFAYLKSAAGRAFFAKQGFAVISQGRKAPRGT